MNRRNFLKIGAAAAIAAPVASMLPKITPVPEVKHDAPITDIVWNGNNFIAFSEDSYIMTSHDGTTWTARAIGV